MLITLNDLITQANIINVVVGFAQAFDHQDWDKLRACLTDPLWTDYSAFRNEPPGYIAADQYVTARQVGLAGLRSVHVSSNHQVTVDGETATCTSAYQIYRVNPALPEPENQLFTTGHYEHGLIHINGQWLINRICQTVVLKTGNPLVHGALR